MHAIDLATKTDYAIGSMTQGGFEKIVELATPSTNHVIIGLSGYNGDFSGYDTVFQARKDEYGLRPDGNEYVWTENVVPFRIYVGVKGLMEDGSPAPEDDFLARNGLRYGQVYGHAIDMSAEGPSSGLWRDAFHKDPELARNGAYVPGYWMPVDWKW